MSFIEYVITSIAKICYRFRLEFEESVGDERDARKIDNNGLMLKFLFSCYLK